MSDTSQLDAPRYPVSWQNLDVALCHDWLTGMRGGERVLELLCRGFPEAEIMTLLCNPEAVSVAISSHPIRTSWLQRIPGIASHYRNWLPFFPGAIERIPPSRGHLLISTSHCVAKGLRTEPGTPHLCYCFTPMRYAWGFHREYLGRKASFLKPFLRRLQRWDRESSSRVDQFVAISRHVRDRIRQHYGREAEVVYPPADTGYFTPGSGPADAGDYDLVVSALVPYKRVDLAIHTYNKTGRRLKVVGAGGQFKSFRALAQPNVEVLGRLPDEEIRTLYRGCRLLIFPGEEDFGIVPLEAMACGRPVIALGRGGALETVVAEKTGLFFDEQNETALARAVEHASQMAWDEAEIRAHAERFGQQQFIDGLGACIDDVLP